MNSEKDLANPFLFLEMDNSKKPNLVNKAISLNDRNRSSSFQNEKKENITSTFKKQHSSTLFKNSYEEEKKSPMLDKGEKSSIKKLHRRSRSFLGTNMLDEKPVKENSPNTSPIDINPNPTPIINDNTNGSSPLNKSISFYQRIKQKMEDNKVKKQTARANTNYTSNYDTHLSFSIGDTLNFIKHENDNLWIAINPKTKHRGLVDIRSFEDLNNKLHKREDYYQNFEQVLWDPKFELILSLATLLKEQNLDKEEIYRKIFALSEDRGCSISLIGQLITKVVLIDSKQRTMEDVVTEVSMYINAYARVVAQDVFNEIVQPIIEMISKAESEHYEIYPEKLKEQKVKKTRENMSKLVNILLSKLYDSSKVIPAPFAVSLDNITGKLIENYSDTKQTKEDLVSLILIQNFLCPMIENPTEFGIVCSNFDKISAPLSYVSKIVNLVAVGEETELPHYACFNGMIKKNKCNIKKFSEFVSTVAKKKSDLKILEAVVDWSSNNKTEHKILMSNLRFVHKLVSLRFHSIASSMRKNKAKITTFMEKTLTEMGIPDFSDYNGKKEKKSVEEKKKRRTSPQPKLGTNFVQQEQRILSAKQGETFLNLSEFDLKLVPVAIFDFKHLLKLDLSNNKLETIPPIIKNLENLEELVLSNNKLIGLPLEFCQMNKLRRLFIDRNKFPLYHPYSSVNASESGEKVLFLVKNIEYAILMKEAIKSGKMVEKLEKMWHTYENDDYLKFLQDNAFLCLMKETEINGNFFVDKISISPAKKGKLYPLHSDCKGELMIINNSNTVLKYKIANIKNETFEVSFLPNEGSIAKGKIINITCTVKLLCSTTLKLIFPIFFEGLGHYHLRCFMVGEESSLIDYKELEFGEVVGKGATAVVHKGTWRGQVVAIKKLLDLDEGEISTMSKIANPYIVKFIGACSLGESNHCIVTEFVDCGTLYDILHKDLKNKSLDWSIKLKWALDGAKALQYLHDVDLLHRDIKSTNFLVSSFDPESKVSMKLCDFGLVRKIDLIMTGAQGTLVWMAPEVFLKKFYNFKADIYSYGIVLWEMCSLVEPYDGLSLFDVSQNLINGVKMEMPEDAPKEWCKIYDICTKKNPDDRITASDLVLILTDLENQGIF